MDDLIKTFHIDWRLLLAQGINFLIVLSVLWYFALRPLMKIMAERETKISNGVKDAELMEGKIKQIDKDREIEIKKGRKEAQEIVANAEKQSEKIREEKLGKTQKEADRVVEIAKQQIRTEREFMVRDVKAELGGLVSLALGKIAGSSIDEKAQKKMVEEAIEELRKTSIKS
ncbi:MAG: F0F1 ATP synthase subunit B [Patescibacteria group bacterium]